MVQKLITSLSDPWVLFGFGAQFLFFMRFLLQWVASERRGKSYIPVIFWWFSIGGGTMLLIYACQRQDPVFMAGQGLGCLIYLRNLALIYKRRARLKARKRGGFEALMEDGLSNGMEEEVAAAGAAAASLPQTDRQIEPVPGKPDPTSRSPSHAAS